MSGCHNMSKLKQDVLNALKKENYISGAQIANNLNISRTSVWKAIESLRESGYEIEAVTNKGYQLVQMPNKIDGNLIENIVKKHQFVDRVFYLETVDSTQTYAMQKLRELDDTFIVVASEQQKGRGRFNRSWVSPNQSGLYMSIVFRPQLSLTEIGKFNFHISLAIQRAIRKVTRVDARIKWPNDIYVGNKKLCGFLTEIISESNHIDSIICGIGINLFNSDNLKEVQTAVSLESASQDNLNIEQFFDALIQSLKEAYDDFKNNRFNEILDEWIRNSNIFERELTINSYNESYRAKALSIDENGFLNVLDSEGTIRKVISADIELN